MKISNLTIIAGMSCAVLGAVTLVFVFSMNVSFNKERASIERQGEFRELGNQLAQASDLLTREARLYAVLGEKQHFDAYWLEVNETKTRDKVVARLKELGATATEMNLINIAKQNSDALIATEEMAMEAVAQNDLIRAQKLMFGKNYDRQKAIIMTPIEEFQTQMNLRAANEVEAAESQSNTFLWLANTVIVFYVLLVLFILYFFFVRRVGLPLARMTKAISQIALGNTSTEIPYATIKNEIGSLAIAAQTFKQNLIEVQSLSSDLERSKNTLEQEVLARTEELTEANNELEEFSYRTSHDLRSPLISSIKLLEVAKTSIAGEQYEMANKCLSHATVSLRKLEILIQDLLILAETKNKGEVDQEVNIGSLVNETLEKMNHMDGVERLEIQCELQFDGVLFTKRSRLNLIFENLISNAIKYQDTEKQNPYIRISTRQIGNQFVVEVEDNGLGISEDQHDKLFSMFQRFHPKIAFGSGLGLYMMKKSADVLDGDLSFHSREQGSMFRLSIPVHSTK